MIELDRRRFVTLAGTIGATLAWSGRLAASTPRWSENRKVFPDGVASGDPDPNSVVLWTRRPFPSGDRETLTVEVALDPGFERVISSERAPVLAEADWTCRVLAAGLQPSTIYWYRFTDGSGQGSRVGRTITAPALADPREVRFAFVSCQSVNEGKQQAYRRMIWDDAHAPADQQLGFVLHLGDFIYEDRRVSRGDADALRQDHLRHRKIPDGRKVGNFHAPTTLEGYRMVYRAHIADPDIQDARAHWPFVCIGDNHEFSWNGWQSYIEYGGVVETAQELRVAANQAWWEYLPSRVRKASGPGLERFDGPKVVNAPIPRLDDYGIGAEPNNLAAIGSMTAYRALKYGRHVELIITDLHSYTMRDPTERPEAEGFSDKAFPFLFPHEALETLDGGRAFAGGNPPAAIPHGDGSIPNFRKDEPPFSVLGREQKAWLKGKLASSKATWKIWAATNGTLDIRTDPLNLPAGMTKPWPGKGFATFGGGDFSGALMERAEIYDHVRDAKVDGFVTVSGDRHSFWAGYAAKALPPKSFDPVGVTFITGSLSAVGMSEALEHGLKAHPLRALYTVDRPGAAPEATLNLMLKRGVASALEYARSGDVERARALTNPDVSPHLEFLDMGGHGYAVVTANAKAIETEFVCINRPINPTTEQDGGPVRYRVAHRTERWKPGASPKMVQRVIEGDPKLSV